MQSELGASDYPRANGGQTQRGCGSGAGRSTCLSQKGLNRAAEVPAKKLLPGAQDTPAVLKDRTGFPHQAVGDSGDGADRSDGVECIRRAGAGGTETDHSNRHECHASVAHPRRHEMSRPTRNRHFAVVPRRSKKLTRPGAAPTTRADAPEIKAAIRPRAA